MIHALEYYYAALLFVLAGSALGMALWVVTQTPPVTSMEECLDRAWPVVGSRVRQWVARRHNAALVLGVARSMQSLGWCLKWDPDLLLTLDEMEGCAKQVRANVVCSLFNGIEEAYERMVLSVTHVCMRLNPALVQRVEQVL